MTIFDATHAPQRDVRGGARHRWCYSLVDVIAKHSICDMERNSVQPGAAINPCKCACMSPDRISHPCSKDHILRAVSSSTSCYSWLTFFIHVRNGEVWRFRVKMKHLYQDLNFCLARMDFQGLGWDISANRHRTDSRLVNNVLSDMTSTGMRK